MPFATKKKIVASLYFPTFLTDSLTESAYYVYAEERNGIPINSLRVALPMHKLTAQLCKCVYTHGSRSSTLMKRKSRRTRGRAKR